MVKLSIVSLFAVVVGSAAAPTFAQSAPKHRADVLGKLGLESIRGIDTDICYPATASEYQALGKNAILMLDSNTAIATELPLRSVYLTYRGVRIPLQRITSLKNRESENGKSSQISFYLLPIHYMKLDSHIAADFSGERSGFGFMTFSAKDKDNNMPNFARLDEYDSPQEPNLSVVSEVLVREYPEQADEL